LKSFERTNRVLPRHLLAPVHYEVGVVQGAGFDVGRFGGGLNVIVIERLADQSFSGFVYLDG